MKQDKGLSSGSTGLLLLSLLRSGDKYGYEMVSLLASYSDDTFQLKEGTLYPLLHGLEKDKCVTSYLAQGPNGRERKYYRITKRGLRRFEEKAEEWQLFANSVNKVLERGNAALQKA